MVDDRAQEALDHLQKSALEFIAAMRAVLDVAEEAVREPQGLRDLLAATGRAVAGVAAVGGPLSPPEAPSRARQGVEHIRVS